MKNWIQDCSETPKIKLKIGFYYKVYGGVYLWDIETPFYQDIIIFEVWNKKSILTCIDDQNCIEYYVEGQTGAALCISMYLLVNMMPKIVFLNQHSTAVLVEYWAAKGDYRV